MLSDEASRIFYTDNKHLKAGLRLRLVLNHPCFKKFYFQLILCFSLFLLQEVRTQVIANDAIHAAPISLH
jgi:hypothetical protein